MAESTERRLFVGNLDAGTTEKDLQNLSKGFEVSNLVLKRKNAVDGESSIPRRRNLPMFQGINAKNEEEQVETKRENSFQRTVPAKQHIQSVQKKPAPAKQHVQSVQKSDTDFCMKKFEEFSSVWRDDATEDSFQIGDGGRTRDFSGYKKESSIRQNSKPRTKSEENERRIEECKPEMNSRCVSEMKRRSALEEKWNAIKEKKNLIRNALKNITPKNSEAQGSSSRVTLFEDDSSDEDTFKPNFEVKSYLDGEKGLKRLNLKAKLASDERFRLDERFFDADDNGTNDTNNFKKNQSTFGSMKRYDPAQSIVPPTQSSEHSTEPKAKKAKLKSNKLRTEPREPPQTAKPEVSKEKHYSVSNNLKEAFRSGGAETSFSLSALFDAHLDRNQRDDSEEKESNSIIHTKKVKYTEHSLENTLVSEDEDADEDNDAPMEVAVPPGKVLGKCGVWGETFFFRPDDSRLTEVPKFYQSSTSEGNKDFGKRRKQLRSIVKKRIQNSRRDKRDFKRKLGGRLNRSKFKMRLKKINLNQ